MNSRITAILISLLSVTGVFATTVIEQNDNITNEIVSDSITMAIPSDSITIPTRSLASKRPTRIYFHYWKQTQPSRFYRLSKCCVCSNMLTA